MKIRAEKLSEKQRMETLDALYTASTAVRGRESTKQFLRDLLTESERIMLGRRILIARRLLHGDTYEDIQTEMRVGVTTIAKVHRWLQDEMPGYEEAICGIEQESRKRKQRYESNKAFAQLKRKYPMHFLLFPWPKGFEPKESKQIRKRTT